MRKVVLMAAALAVSMPASAEMIGFKKERIDEHVWQVRFVGNGFSNTLKSQKKLRCKTGELGLKNGYAYMNMEGLQAGQNDGGFVGFANHGVVSGGRVSMPTAEAVVTFSAEPQTPDQRPIRKWMEIWEC